MITWVVIGLLVWCYYMIYQKTGRDHLAKVYWDIGSEYASLEIFYSLCGVIIGFVGTVVAWPITIYNNECRKKQ